MEVYPTSSDVWLPDRRLAWRATIPAAVLVPGLGLLGWVLGDADRALFAGAFVFVGVLQFLLRWAWWSFVLGGRHLEARPDALVVVRRFGGMLVLPWVDVSRVVLDPGDRRPEWGDFPSAGPMVDFPDFVAYGHDAGWPYMASPALFAATPREVDRLRDWLAAQCALREIAFEVTG